jgi:uncharacterized SAM-dependent methyltransferase
LLPPHSRASYRNFFPPARAGNLRECALLKTPDESIRHFAPTSSADWRSRLSIPARWFYDRRGSELFDDITRLPSYYPTRTETALLEAKIDEIARLLPKDSAVVEFGSGS